MSQLSSWHHHSLPGSPDLCHGADLHVLLHGGLGPDSPEKLGFHLPNTENFTHRLMIKNGKGKPWGFNQLIWGFEHEDTMQNLDVTWM